MTILNSPSNALPLSAGAVWRGSQTSGQSSYDVEIRICGVDDKGDVCGTLTIRNLTPTLPKLVTFFDGEIIGPHHSFITNKWDATEQDDSRHWNRFKRDLYLKGAISDSTEIPDNLAFMRLKERCVVNNEHSERDVSGASFAGFYYIAVELCPESHPTRPSMPEGFRARAPSSSVSSLPSFQRSPSPSAWSQASFSPSPSPQSPIADRLSIETDSPATTSPTLMRSSSYASVVRGRSSAGSAPIDIPSASYGDDLGSSLKADENGVTVAVQTPMSSVDDASSRLAVPAPFSPSFDEFPPPASLLPTLGRSTGDIAYDKQRRDASPSSRASIGSGSYNPRTGYRGAWAQATMKGFYFASSTDPYQELELHYVGDGMGSLLEEYDDDYELVDRLGNLRLVDRESHILKDFQRREQYQRPKASAAFEIL